MTSTTASGDGTGSAELSFSELGAGAAHISRQEVCSCGHSVTAHSFNTAGTKRTRCDTSDPTHCACKTFELHGYWVWRTSTTYEAL